MHQDESFLPSTTMPIFYYRGPQGQALPSRTPAPAPGMGGMGDLGAMSKPVKYGGVALSLGLALVGFVQAFKASGMGAKLPWMMAMAAGGAGAVYLATRD